MKHYIARARVPGPTQKDNARFCTTRAHEVKASRPSVIGITWVLRLCAEHGSSGEKEWELCHRSCQIEPVVAATPCPKIGRADQPCGFGTGAPIKKTPTLWEHHHRTPKCGSWCMKSYHSRSSSAPAVSLNQIVSQ